MKGLRAATAICLLALACDLLAAPVTRMRLDSSQGWIPVKNSSVLLIDHRGEAWMLQLAPPCQPLQLASRAALTGAGGWIVAGRDDWVVDGTRCRVQSAQAVALPSALKLRPLSLRPRAPADAMPWPRGYR